MKKFYWFYSITLLLFFINHFQSQVLSGLSYKEYFTEGNHLMLENNYSLALQNYLHAYELEPYNANINYLLGKAYLFSATEKNKAEEHLAKAINKIKKNYIPDDPSEKSAPVLALYYYAQALHINYKFDEAIQYYDRFLQSLGKAAKSWEKEVTFKKNQSIYAKTLVSNPINIKITNLGDSINSEYPEYGAVLTADEQMLIYTTRRPGGVCGDRTADGGFYEDIVVSFKLDDKTWSKPKPLSEYVNTCGHEASINLSPDGQILILYKDDEGGNIYYSQWDGKNWSSPQSFGSDVNTPHWETHACLSPDGNTLYFVSDRPGGVGGRDIYRVVKLPNGKWSKAVNLGYPINTPYDEDGVFMHPDGKTLFFSSNGHTSMGGFDIFFSVRDEEGKFSEPINLGYPINTPDDDLFYVTSPDGKRAYYSSVQEGGLGDKDIYMISIPESAEKPVVIYKGKIVAAFGEALPDDITIVLTDKESGETVGMYRPQKNGSFVFTLRPGANYKVSYQSNGEEFFSDEIYADKSESYQEIQKELQLEPVKVLGKITVKEKGIILNISCFNDFKEKKPLSNAIVYVIEERKNKNYGVYKTDDNGNINNILLSAGKTYTLVFEHNHKVIEERAIQTPQTQLGEALTEIFFLNKEGATAGKKYLSVKIINSKNKKPIPDASVVIKSDNGNQIEQVTDNKGNIDKIELLAGLNYTILPYKSGYYGEPLIINTSDLPEGLTIKTLSIKLEGKSKEDITRYEVYFKYKEYAIDTNDVKWKNFINNIITKSQQGKVTIYITASASKVPASMTNIVLSKMRGEFLRDQIVKYLITHGGNKDNIHFKINAIVSGPEYSKKTPAKVYEKYQYVKAITE
ncbi:MAG: hypothetical protein KatS3mg027_2132 [Bacteroidia bacterium]|nr:MAG: hypothetical protein KatS3mg027_2132 [Bacteroidia bacterium]